ncbi:translation initiation factor IF-2-like [Lutra lutra]|uniref:translation initiation factor IF-2-like n=1 Tax=Lutra lutra TaxID=9657 RepID=UPI001FD316F4|nr:translation initiation factor IF-2-like [Lutra lutra]XP_047556597.1 translation initiation factor IF-2-like [Lutra lutra]
MRSGTAGPRAGCGDRPAAAASRRQGDRTARAPRWGRLRHGAAREAHAEGPQPDCGAGSPADPPRRRGAARTAGCGGGQRGQRPPGTDLESRRPACPDSAAAHLALGRAVRPRPGVEPRSRGRRAASWAQARAGKRGGREVTAHGRSCAGAVGRKHRRAGARKGGRRRSGARRARRRRIGRARDGRGVDGAAMAARGCRTREAPGPSQSPAS